MIGKFPQLFSLFFASSLLVCLVGCGHKDTSHIPKVNQQQLDQITGDESYQELYARYQRTRENGNLFNAIAFAEKLLRKCDDRDQKKQLILDLAEMSFDYGRYDKAALHYTTYMTLYPGSDEIELVSYKSLLCKFYQTLSSDRDQTRTKQTLTAAEAFLEKDDVFITYADDVQNIRTECLTKLLESEINVFNQKLKMGTEESLKAATMRLNYMRDEFIPKIPECQAQLLTLETDLAYARGDEERAEQCKAELATRFDTHYQVAHAQQSDKKSAIELF